MSGWGEGRGAISEGTGLKGGALIYNSESQMTDPSIRAAYDQWAGQYDSDENDTRDLNAEIFRKQTFFQPEDHVLEIGCGTGLNTQWLVAHAGSVVATDFSDEMLDTARRRLSETTVRLQNMDVTASWPFDTDRFDCVVATLVLEHVEHLGPIFREARRVLQPGGHFYVSELHPYRQLHGTQANFNHEASGESVIIDAFTHPVSEFVNEGLGAGFSLREMGEWYGSEDDVPRLLSILFEG